MKNVELAKRIKEQRSRRGFSQDELAIASQLNLRTIQRIESGETEPRGDTIKRLAIALQLSPDELIEWGEEEDNTTLMLLNISALSFIVFPLLGVIIPLVLWISKKDKIKNLNITGKKLINFQISWCIFQFLLFFSGILLKILHIPGNLRIIPGLSAFELLLVTSFPIMYLFNGILILINARRSHNNKAVIYQPAIPFLR